MSTTYWVKFTWTMTTDNAESDNSNLLTFDGYTLGEFGAVPVQFMIPSGAKQLSPSPYYDWMYPVLGYSGAPQGQWVTDNVLGRHFVASGAIYVEYKTAIAASYVVGSQPDPTVLEGPQQSVTIHNDLDDIDVTSTYTTFDWAQVTIPDNAPVVTTAPASINAQSNVATPVVGISVADADAVSTSETITVVLRDATGLLSASGVGVIGSGTTALTLTGSLANVNADLATVSFLGNVGDTVDVATNDGRGSSDDHKIAVITRPSSLALDQHSLSSAINLAKNQFDVIISSPTSGTVTFNDTDSSATVVVTESKPVISASGPSGSPPIMLTAAQETAIANALSIPGPSQRGNSGAIDWAYDPRGLTLDFIALGERINIVQQIVVTDQSGRTDQATLTIALNGPHPTPQTAVELTTIESVKTIMAGAIKAAASLAYKTGVAEDPAWMLQVFENVAAKVDLGVSLVVIESQFTAALLAAKGDVQAQWQANKDAFVAVYNAAVRTYILTGIQAVITEYGLTAATWVATSTTGSATAAAGSAAAEVFLTGLVGVGTAATLVSVAPAVLVAGTALGAAYAYDQFFADTVKADGAKLFELGDPPPVQINPELNPTIPTPTPIPPTAVNNADGTSYLYAYNPSATVTETVATYSGVNATGTMISDIVDNTDGTSLLYAYNPTSTVILTATKFAGTDAANGAPIGAKVSAVVDNTDGTALVYAYNPTSTVTLTATKFASTDTANGAPTGSKVSAVVDNTDGTVLVYAYNPSSSVTQTATRFAGTNPDGSPSGAQVSAVVDNLNGTSIVYAYNPSSSVTQTASFYSGTDPTSGAPTGTLTSETFDYTNSQSSVTTYNSDGTSVTTNYSGPDGTGSVIASITPSVTAASSPGSAAANEAVTTTAVSSQTVASPDNAVIAFAASGQSIDPGPGNHMIQFISGATSDTLVLHLAGSDQVQGFDPAAGDMLDLRSLLSEAQVNVGTDMSQLGSYISITDIGGSASIAFDPTGHGGGSQVAWLVNGGGMVAQLQTLKSFIG